MAAESLENEAFLELKATGVKLLENELMSLGWALCEGEAHPYSAGGAFQKLRFHFLYLVHDASRLLSAVTESSASNHHYIQACLPIILSVG